MAVALAALTAFVGSAALGLTVGIANPRVHDEFSYLLAADTFAHGRLTNPTHPLWEHFESFHIIQQPTYMSKYPPAQGLALAAGQWIAGHPIVGVWLSFAFMSGAVAWMLFAWLPPRWALYGTFLAIIHPVTGIGGYWAQGYWGGALAAAGGALLLGGIRRVVHGPSVRNALLLALGLAILANSRPYEGLLMSVPVGVFLSFWIIKGDAPSIGVAMKRVGLPLILVLTVTAGWMAFYNYSITGDALRAPYWVHEQTYARHPTFLWQSPPEEPNYRHKAIDDFHAAHALSIFYDSRSITGFIVKNTGSLLLLALGTLHIYFVPLLAVMIRRRPVAVATSWRLLVIFIYLFLLFGVLMITIPPWFHYAAPVLGLNYAIVAYAMRLWRERDRKIGTVMLWLLPISAIGITGGSFYSLTTKDTSANWHNRRAQILTALQSSGERHLIVVSYGPGHSPHSEWVYNEADIDNAKVVWARHMDGQKDCRLIEYFTSRRHWWLSVDEKSAPPQLQSYPAARCQKVQRLPRDG